MGWRGGGRTFLCFPRMFPANAKIGHGIVVTVDATHRPDEFFHLHAGIADYFHHGGQRFQNFGLQKLTGKLVDLEFRTA